MIRLLYDLQTARRSTVHLLRRSSSETGFPNVQKLAYTPLFVTRDRLPRAKVHGFLLSGHGWAVRRSGTRTDVWPGSGG